MFPYSCKQGNLTPQEKSLEFMLFDLTACVSPDSWTPGTPEPPGRYYPTTFAQDFVAHCEEMDGGKGKHVVWREFDWQASIPAGTSIDFAAQTADTASDMATATSVGLLSDPVTTSTTLPNWDAALLDTGSSGAFRNANPAIAPRNTLRIAITLNPNSTGTAAPTLLQWKVQYDCVDSE